MKSVDLYGLHLKPAVRPHNKFMALLHQESRRKVRKVHILLGNQPIFAFDENFKVPS